MTHLAFNEHMKTELTGHKHIFSV